MVSCHNIGVMINFVLFSQIMVLKCLKFIGMMGGPVKVKFYGKVYTYTTT